MKRLLAALTLLLAPLTAQAGGVAGTFDYYVLALSWSPSWCATEGQGRDEAQCDPGRKAGFVIHGLWPQYERGWPDYCDTAERDPSRRDSQAMADVMGSGRLAWYQWQKHGRCSGLSARGYYQTIRAAGQAVQVPALFRMLPRDVTLPTAVIEDAFLQANPGLRRDGITVTCAGGRIDEVRICLTRDLRPRDCAPDSRRDCTRPMLMEAPR